MLIDMYFPRFWARSDAIQLPESGERKELVVWHWSDDTPLDAKIKADLRAVELFKLHMGPWGFDRYSYGHQNTPMREEVVEGAAPGIPVEAAIISRNQYGALVLNAAQTMFIDIDFKTFLPQQSASGCMGALVGAEPSSDAVEQPTLEKIRGWAKGRSDLAMRVYRTFAGMRCVVINRTFDPVGSETADVLQSIGSDPLYIKLCQSQKSFRARLTPKPWRCGFKAPPNRYPRLDAEQESAFVQWRSQYEQHSTGYSVCRFVEQIGSVAAVAEIDSIVQLHDQMSKAQVGGPLA